MVTAEYFSYDGKSSREFGLMLADFNSGNPNEAEAYDSEISTFKAPYGVRFYYSGKVVSSAPTIELSMVSEIAIPTEMERTMMAWLIGKRKFAPLIFNQTDLGFCTYYVAFSKISKIFVNGNLHGFKVTGLCDSQFARRSPVVKVVNITNATPRTDDHVIVTLNNRSDIFDDYTYPTVSFTGDVKIVELTDPDDPGRAFQFSNVSSGDFVTVNNETKVITHTVYPNTSLLGNFNKNWLRLVSGVNRLGIYAPSGYQNIITITCPTYALIGY